MNLDLAIDVPEIFDCHINAALLRLRYLYPEWEISAAKGLVKVANVSPGDVALVRREVNYAIYRERIRSEGAPLRELLLKSVMT